MTTSWSCKSPHEGSLGLLLSWQFLGDFPSGRAVYPRAWYCPHPYTAQPKSAQMTRIEPYLLVTSGCGHNWALRTERRRLLQRVPVKVRARGWWPNFRRHLSEPSMACPEESKVWNMDDVDLHNNSIGQQENFRLVCFCIGSL